MFAIQLNSSQGIGAVTGRRSKRTVNDLFSVTSIGLPFAGGVHTTGVDLAPPAPSVVVVVAAIGGGGDNVDDDDSRQS